MQNFTLGKKGYSMLLFALVLLIGSSPTFGQCASVNDENAVATDGNQQSYCYLSTVQDLLNQGTDDGDPNDAPANIEIYETANSTNDTDPLDRDELLTNGTTYYFGDSTDSSCTRAAVIVSVNTAPTPTNTVTGNSNGFTVTPCESSAFSGSDLLDLFNTAPAGYTLRVYDDEFRGSEITNYSATLSGGESYFVGADPNDPNADCPSQRVAVGIDVIEAPAPTVVNPQIVCEGATIADLEAESTSPNFQAFRWYREEFGGSPLANNVELVNGEDYFVSQIVNQRGSIFPPCESLRTRVVVEIITFDAGDDVTGEICEDDLRQRIADGEGASILFSFVDDGRDPFPSQVSFDPSLGALAQQFEDGATELFTTATFTTPEGCTDDVDFTLTINESYNAGDDNTEGNVVCRDVFSETVTEDEVTDYLTSLLSDDADAGGVFSNVTSITNDINSGLEGPFNSTYTVGEGEPCEDTADFAFEVDQADDLGIQTGNGIYCQSDINERIASGPASNNFYRELARQLFLEQLDSSVPQDGEFVNSTLAQVVTAYGNGIRTFSTTYSITTENGCTSSVDISFDIIEDTNAGDDNLTDNIACRSEFSTIATETEVENYLASLLSNDADTNGNFSNLTSIASSITSGDNGPFTSTYTTGVGTECSDTADFQFSVIDVMPANAGSFDWPIPVCENDNPINLFTDIENNEPDAMKTGTFSGMGVTNNVFDPSAVTPGETYTITYTVSADPENCITGPESSTTFDITVDPAPISANIARELCVTQARELISNESEGYAYILGILTESGVENFDVANFDPAPFAEAEALADFIETPSSDTETFNFTYKTPSENSCEAGVINIAITINNTEQAEVNIDDFDVCLSEDPLNLFTYLDLSGGTFSYGSTEIENGLIDVSTLGELPEITYTVNEDVDTTDCIEGSDSSTFTVDVVAPVSAGKDKSRTLCRAQVRAIYSEGTARNYFLGLLDAGVPRDGTFDPLIQTLVDRYNDSGEKLGTYTSTYTVQNGSCTDTAEISVVIIANTIVQAGPIANQETCVDGESITLTTLLNADTTTLGGTFSGTGVTNGIFNPATSGIGTFTITYTVNTNNTPCASRNVSRSFTIKVTEDASQAEVGTIANQETCVDGETITLATLLNAGTTTLGGTFTGTGVTNGIFNPAIAGVGTSTITYNVNGDDNNCIIGNASGTFTIKVTEEATPAQVGTIANQETCVDDQSIALATLLNAANTTLGGTFTGTGVTNGIFNPATAGVGITTITYSVVGDDLPCTIGNASRTFTINVTDEESQAEVGTIANQETCVDGEAITLATLLNAANTTLGGTFTGTGVTNGIFNPSTAGVGTTTITYSVVGDDLPCTSGNASGTFTINVTDEESQAEVGTIANQETCVDGEAITLATLLNAANTTLGGTFTGAGVTNGIFNPTTAGVGTFTITYDVSGEDDACVIGNASGSFTILVTEEATQSEVGVIENQEACINGETIALATLLNADDTTLGGTFTGTGVTDGVFDPAAAGTGIFTITYEVNGDNEPCIDGNASGTFTINVTDLDAPTAVASQSFCLIDSPTVGDIVVEGDNIVIYTDADLTEVADATTALGSGMDYYAVSSNDSGSCSSEATVISVTITDPSAPALTIDGDEFCRSDNPTVQDLINNFSGSGVLIYSSSTGGTAISATTALQNGVTYYGASVNTTSGCESSERTAVVTKVEFCGIPEGFSPNGDGKNDKFVIPDIAENFPNYSIEIFNRWGNVVFKGNASTGDWDGISNQSGTLGNDVLPVGVYFYILKYNDGQTTPVQGKLYLSI